MQRTVARQNAAAADTNDLQLASPTSNRQRLALLAAAQPNIIHLRDGEVVLYLRSRSLHFQCRYKLADGSWYRQSTGKASIEHAVIVACNLYDEARYRQRLGLAHQAHTFAHIARIVLAELRQKIDASKGRTSANDYVSCIERYFLPYFAERRLEELTHTDIREFELWRDRQMDRKPKTSTLSNFASAWNKIVGTAVERGYISERVPVPRLTAKGEKGKTRPGFSAEEVDALLAFMATWQHTGKKQVEKEIRPLLRDYVEMLLLTGIRHGTEAMGICWNNLEWHTDKGVRYLRIWVSGKTGGRWLIAKHRAAEVLQRLHARQLDIKNIPFEELFTARLPHKLFRFSNGHQPHSFIGTFEKLMRDSGMEMNVEGQKRTLYSLRHTYATLELLKHSTDIHTLSKQMGNSAAMIERHYSKLTATMAAEQLA